MTRDFSFLTPSNMVAVHESFRILNENTPRYTLSQHYWNNGEDKTDFGRLAMAKVSGSARLCFPPSRILQEERPTSLALRGTVGMSTTNPRIKLFNGKAGSPELFFGNRDVLGFPIHFARPSGRQEGEVIYIGGGCRAPSFPSSLTGTGDITPARCAHESLWNIFG